MSGLPATVPAIGSFPAGRKASTNLPYLAWVRRALIFRIRVPAAIQSCLGRREYRRSLGTHYARDAKIKSLKLAAAAHEVFALARAVIIARDLAEGYTHHPEQWEEYRLAQQIQLPDGMYTNLQGRTLDSLTDDEIRAIAEDWLLAALKDHHSMMRKAASLRREKNKALTPEQMNEENREKAEFQRTMRGKHAAIHKAALAQRELSHMHTEADRMLDAYGVSVPLERTEYPQYQKTCEELAKARVTFYKLEDEYEDGEFSRYEDELRRLESTRGKLTAAPKPDTAPQATPEESILLAEAIEEMCREKSLDGSWRPKVALGERNKLELFQAVIDPDGTLPVKAIKPAHLSRYRSLLHLMPASRGKKREYRDLPLSELIRIVENRQVPDDIRMETNTIKTYCQSVTAFINWAARRDYHDKPSISGLLQVKAEKQAHEFRDPYFDEDIAKLFAPKLFTVSGMTRKLGATKEGTYQPDSGGSPSRFWVPLLGLFDDIVLVNHQEDARKLFVPGEPMPDAASIQTAEANGETLCLFINKGKPYQRLKTASSRRYVPLSSVLAHELGFIRYATAIFENAEQARSQGRNPAGDGRLFPELTRRKETDNFAHTLSKWFNTYRAKAGVTVKEGGGKKDFHSFRHTVARWSELNEVPEKSAARYLGHTHDTMTFGRYGAETAAHKLHERITKGYAEYLRSLLDIDGLKKSKWAGSHE